MTDIYFANKTVCVNDINDLIGRTAYIRNEDDNFVKVTLEGGRTSIWDNKYFTFVEDFITDELRSEEIYIANDDGTIDIKCAYCRNTHAYTEMPRKYDGRFICDDCLEQHTFVCIECGEVHDMRRRMKGMNLCRPCFDQYVNTKYVRLADGSNNVVRLGEAVAVFTVFGDLAYVGREWAETNTFICDICGNRHFIDGDRVKYNGKTMCHKCADEYAPTCPICHHRHLKRNTHEVDGVTGICSRCYNNSAILVDCAKCGKKHYLNHMVTVRNVGRVCRECRTGMYRCGYCETWYESEEAANAEEVITSDGATVKVCGFCVEHRCFRCSDCGRLFVGSGCHTSNGLLCRECYRINYKECCGCGAIIEKNERFHGDVEHPLCAYCFDSADHGMSNCIEGAAWADSSDRRNHIRSVNGYSYKPTPYLFPMKNDSGNPHHLFYGVELESESHDYYKRDGLSRSEITEKANNLFGITYGKSDCSIGDDGIEFVSHPASIGWYMDNKQNWAEGMKFLRQHGYSSHTGARCGLHVHVSSFPLEYETDNGIEKLLWFMSTYQQEMVKFSRRKQSQIADWARVSTFDTDSPDVAKTAKRVKNDLKGGDHSSRYHAINLQNRHTVEFRLMRGTLNIEAFMATVQLISNICETAMEKTFDEFRELDWNYFIERNNYSDLKNYWASRMTLSVDDAEEYDRDDTSVPEPVKEECTFRDDSEAEEREDLEEEVPLRADEFTGADPAVISANDSVERNIADNTVDPAVTPGVPTGGVISGDVWERVTLAAAEFANAVPSVPPHVEQRMRELFQQYDEAIRGIPNLETVIDCMSAATVGA